jgi:hypothetical protein
MYNPKRGTNLSIRFLWCYGDREAFCKKIILSQLAKMNVVRTDVVSADTPGGIPEPERSNTLSRLSMLDAGTLRNGLDSFKPR